MEFVLKNFRRLLMECFDVMCNITRKLKINLLKIVALIRPFFLNISVTENDVQHLKNHRRKGFGRVEMTLGIFRVTSFRSGPSRSRSRALVHPRHISSITLTIATLSRLPYFTLHKQARKWLYAKRNSVFGSFVLTKKRR